MTTTQILLTIALLAVGTMLTRFLPFIIFRENREAPKFVQYLGNVLPAAIFSMLVVYCLKDVKLTAAPFGIPEAIGCAAVALLHIWKRNTLLSIGAGTLC